MSRVRLVRQAGAGDPVIVQRPDHGAPTGFVWRGRAYQVRSVEADRGSRAAAVAGLERFRLRTANGLRVVLAHDPASGAWKIERVIAPGSVR